MALTSGAADQEVVRVVLLAPKVRDLLSLREGRLRKQRKQRGPRRRLRQRHQLQLVDAPFRPRIVWEGGNQMRVPHVRHPRTSPRGSIWKLEV